MKLEWTKNSKTDKEKQELEEILRRSTIPFRRLGEIIKENLNRLDSEEGSIKDFDTPGWAYKQAARNRERAVHKYYLDLITFDQKGQK